MEFYFLLTYQFVCLEKHSQFMANVKLVFSGTETSRTEQHTLVCYHNASNDIFIEIETGHQESSYICLDRSTAIKLHRELKKQISFIESEEVNNG